MRGRGGTCCCACEPEAGKGKLLTNVYVYVTTSGRRDRGKRISCEHACNFVGINVPGRRLFAETMLQQDGACKAAEAWLITIKSSRPE